MNRYPVADRIAVVVPARNEEALLGRCLDALTAATRQVEAPVTLVVVLDRCTDGSEEVARSRPGVEVVHSTAGLAGAARRAGAHHALSRSGADPARFLLASTDADSTVPSHWLAHHHGLVMAGAGLVLGTVQPEPGGLAPRVLRAWAHGYHPRDGHPHVHGANLAVRGDVYLAAGGFAPVAAHEDVLLVEAVTRSGVRVERTAGCPVVTSSRLSGRAPEGFAAHLAALCTGRAAGPDGGRPRRQRASLPAGSPLPAGDPVPGTLGG